MLGRIDAQRTGERINGHVAKARGAHLFDARLRLLQISFWHRRKAGNRLGHRVECNLEKWAALDRSPRGDERLSPVAHDPSHLAERLGAIGKEHEGEQAEGRIERFLGEVERLRVHHLGLDVADAATRGTRLQFVDHLRRKIHGRHARDPRRREKRERPRPRRDVENAKGRTNAHDAQRLVRVHREKWRDVFRVAAGDGIPDFRHSERTRRNVAHARHRRRF